MAQRAADRFRETIRKVIEPAFKEDTEEEIDMRVEMLLICMHGLGVQASTYSGEGVRALATATEFVLQTVLSTALHSVAPPKFKAA